MKYRVLQFSSLPTVKDMAKRQREKVAALTLCRGIFGENVTISHTPDGAPFIPQCPGWFISISHSRSAVAVAWSSAAPVGIDIEERSPALRRVASRFLSPDELDAFGESDDTLLRAWTIKEAVYKAAGIKELLSSEIAITAGSNTAVAEHNGIKYRFKLEFPDAGTTLCIKEQ